MSKTKPLQPSVAQVLARIGQVSEKYYLSINEGEIVAICQQYPHDPDQQIREFRLLLRRAKDEVKKRIFVCVESRITYIAFVGQAHVQLVEDMNKTTKGPTTLFVYVTDEELAKLAAMLKRPPLQSIWCDTTRIPKMHREEKYYIYHLVLKYAPKPVPT